MTPLYHAEELHARIARSFRRSLYSYARNATLQHLIARLLVRRLYRAGAPAHLERAFEFGCGTGNLTRTLTERFTIDRLWLNDLVSDVRTHLPDTGAAFVEGAVENIALPKDLDLIASASTIQWIDTPGPLFEKFGTALRPGGWLALSGYGPAQFRELEALGSKAGAPRYLGAADLCRLLPEGLEALEARSLRRRLWFDSPREILAHLRETGVNGLASGGWTRRDLAAFEAEYTERFELNRRVPLTYEPVWLIARKR